jgi:hypothetical protein
MSASACGIFCANREKQQAKKNAMLAVGFISAFDKPETLRLQGGSGVDVFSFWRQYFTISGGISICKRGVWPGVFFFQLLEIQWIWLPSAHNIRTNAIGNNFPWVDSGVDVFGGAGGRGHRQDARATLDKRTGLFGADLNGAKVGLTGMKGYAAFLQNAGFGRGGTQSDALGWYTVSRWDTGRRKDEGWTVGQTSSVVLAGEVTGRMPVPLWMRGQGFWGVRR